MAVFRLIFGLGVTGGGASAPSFNFSLDNQTIADDAVENDDVGDFVPVNEDGSVSYVLDSAINYFIPNAIVFSSTEVDDESTAGTVVATVSESRSLQTITWSLSADPDDKFEMVGNEIRLTSTVDLAMSATHSLTVRATTPRGQTYDQVQVITVESISALSFNRTDGIAYGAFVSTTTVLAGADIGSPSSTRVILVAFGKGANPTAPTCTIGGVSAPQVAGGSAARSCNLFALAVPTGTSADIIVTHGSINSRAFDVYETHNITSLTPTATVIGSDGSSLYDLSINTPVGDALVFPFTVNRDGEETATWVGTTEVSLQSTANVDLSSAPFISSTAETPHVMSVDWSNTPFGSALAVVLQ